MWFEIEENVMHSQAFECLTIAIKMEFSTFPATHVKVLLNNMFSKLVRIRLVLIKIISEFQEDFP